MWVPSVAISYFDRLVKAVEDNAESMQNTIQVLREELAKAHAENHMLRDDLKSTRVTGDWLRMKVNQLEMQNTALMEKAYQIKLPVAPEIVRVPRPQDTRPFENFSFEDSGDAAAAVLGLPHYGLDAPTKE